ncbi:MAG: glycosyltransferase [Clostridia bacterium]|nr:glycosyltransferase [Clostridia bacterium]
MEKFSVSICVYGGDNAQYFDLAMQSIFNQTLMPDEVVLVVDGPVGDNINDIITKYQGETLKVIRLPQNVGHGDARRIGLENCTYDLVALMDADDICVTDRFQKQIEAFTKNPDISIVGGQISEFIDSIDNIVGQRIVPLEDKDIKEYMKKRCPMNQVTVMFRKKDVQSVGGYIDWYCEEDYYLWIRMALADLKFLNVPDVLVNVRVGNEMYQRRGGLKYFKSEAKLHKFMYDNKIIGFPRYFISVSERLILQVLMPNWLRGIVFKIFAREKAEG